MDSATFLSGRVTLHAGDCLTVLPTLDENSVDSCVCDPPYHLASIVKRFGKPNSAPVRVPDASASNCIKAAHARASAGFMGKVWDGGDIAFRPETWAAVLRVLKPGAHLVAFAAPKNAHRMFCAIEDGGFEIRDTIAWLFGSGFPKSHNVAKSLDGILGTQAERFNTAGGGLPPIRRKELRSDNLNYKQFEPSTDAARQWQGWGTALKPAYEPICLARKPLIGTIAANVLKHGVGAINVDGCRIDSCAQSFADTRATKHNDVYGKFEPADYDGSKGRWPANVIHDGSDEVVEAFPESSAGVDNGARGTGGIWSPSSGVPCGPQYGDSGSAARFFYSSKADADDRIGSKHPTVKPLDLMQYLVRLVTPPKGLILDPFAGTGTTGEAAWREGFNAVLIEREAEYLADIERRMSLCLAGPDERARESIKARQAGKPQDNGPLFDEAAA